MNAYVINSSNNQALGRFESVDMADKFGQACLEDDYFVVTDAQDIEKLMSRQAMVDAYNRLTGAELKKFSTKQDGAQRLYVALEQAELAAMTPQKKARVKKEKAPPAELGYKGHRAGSRKAAAHEKFDALFATRHGRVEIIEAIVSCGVEESTAKSWYQVFRRQALDERTPK